MLCLKWGFKLMLLNELASCFDILHEICIQLMLRSIWSFMRSSLFKTYSISIVLQSVWWEALVYQRIDPVNQLRHNDKQPKSDTRNYRTGKCDFTISRTELSHVKSLILKTSLHHGVHVQQRICETLEIAQSMRKFCFGPLASVTNMLIVNVDLLGPYPTSRTTSIDGRVFSILYFKPPMCVHAFRF